MYNKYYVYINIFYANFIVHTYFFYVMLKSFVRCYIYDITMDNKIYSLVIYFQLCIKLYIEFEQLTCRLRIMARLICRRQYPSYMS